MNYNIRISNSLTNRLDDFKPIKENEVSMYEIIKNAEQGHDKLLYFQKDYRKERIQQ